MILTFFLLSLLVLFLDQWTGGWTTMHLFCVYRSSLKDPLFYIRLFGHVLGHAGWEHFLNNMLLLLVVGPPMEEKYGSKALLGGIVFTALVTGVLQCVLFPRTGLLGASGIVFMLIMLSSLAGFSGGIPVTMLLVAALYFGQQVYDIILVHDNVANFMHIVGGLCGTAFGYYFALERISSYPYQCIAKSVDVQQVANLEKKVPLDWITPDGMQVTAAFEEYARPLILDEVTPVYVNGTPRHIRL